MMMLKGPEEEVGGSDTAEQSEAEEGGDTLEEEVESGWEASPMELEGCKEVELQQQEKAPKGFLSLTAEEKAATAVIEGQYANLRTANMRR